VTPSARRIVAVDGLDGSGKSRLANALAAACAADGVAVTQLHVDDFRRDVDFAGLDAGEEAARYYADYFDLAALDRALASFQAGSAGDAELAIVEGVFTLRVPAVAASAGLIVLTVSAGRGAPPDPRARSPQGPHRRGDRAPHRPALFSRAGTLPRRPRSRGARRRDRGQRGLAPPARRPLRAWPPSGARRALARAVGLVSGRHEHRQRSIGRCRRRRCCVGAAAVIRRRHRDARRAARRHDAGRGPDHRRARHQAIRPGAPHARHRRQRRHGGVAAVAAPNAEVQTVADGAAAASIASGLGAAVVGGDVVRVARGTPARASPTRPAGAPPRTRCSRRCSAPISGSSPAG
jgi:hypothetical protein